MADDSIKDVALICGMSFKDNSMASRFEVGLSKLLSKVCDVPWVFCDFFVSKILHYVCFHGLFDQGVNGLIVASIFHHISNVGASR